MPFQSKHDLTFFQFDAFASQPVQHAIFTRQGGVSPKPWNSLNVGGTVGDAADRVSTNRKRAFQAVGRELESLHDVWQVHSADFVLAAQPRNGNPYVKADILLTSNPEVTLFMRFADCVPIMLYDPMQHAVALVHAGWLGTVRGAALVAVEAMRMHFNSKAVNLIAGLGPSIGPDHYEVGREVQAHFHDAFSGQSDKHFTERDGSIYLDLWSANEFQLRSSGIERIEIASLCTACDLQRWYSHRAEAGSTGRFGALLALHA